MYEDEYFFIRKPRNQPRLPYLNPDKTTAQRPFRTQAIPVGQPPLVFHNEDAAANRAKGVRSVVPDILFEGFNLVVRDGIRERLLNLDVPALHVYPSVYIDDDERWHEDFWYLTFTTEFDCWDRATSDFDPDPVTAGRFTYFNVFTYRFDQQVMQATPLAQRLLFKMGGALDAHIVAHESILTRIFGPHGSNGAEYVKVSDY